MPSVRLLAQDGTPDSDHPSRPEASSQSEPEASPHEDTRDRIYYPVDTENLRPLTTKLVRNIFLDQKEIWTSPFHMHKQDSKWWIGFGAITAALIATDHKSSTLLENSPTQIAWGNRVSNVGASYTLIPVVAGFYTTGVLAHNAQAREVGVLGTEALLDSLIVVEALKPIGGRVRPDSTTGERGQFFDGGDSFPSGHAIESWALASLIAHEYKRRGGKFVPYVAYGLAGLVSVARFGAERHYASDIVAGGAMGWFIGRYVYQTHEDHAGHQHAWLHPQVVPSVDPVTQSYMVSLRLGL